MGILQLAPVKQLRETSDQKLSNIFKVCAVLLPVQLCCMPANASRFWNHERYLRTGLMISLFRAIKTWGYKDGNLKQKSSYFILIPAKVPWPALCQCRIRPWQQCTVLIFFTMATQSPLLKLGAAQTPSECIRRDTFANRKWVETSPAWMQMSPLHAAPTFVRQCLPPPSKTCKSSTSYVMCSSQAGFAFMSKSVCMNVWTIVKPVSFEMIQIDQGTLPSLKEAFARPFSFALLPFGCMECKRWLSRIISWDSTALHIAEA